MRAIIWIIYLEHFDETYEEMLEIFEEFKRKLYYQV
mgnify:CR=1 FL=1